MIYNLNGLFDQSQNAASRCKRRNSLEHDDVLWEELAALVDRVTKILRCPV